MIAIMMTMSLIVLAFNQLERPWKEAEMNYLASANEVFLYSLLALVLTAISISDEPQGRADSKGIVDWLIIAVATIWLHVNLVVILAKAYHHCKLLKSRYINNKAFLESKKKVAPASCELVNRQTVYCDLESPLAVRQDRCILAAQLPDIEEESSMKEDE